MDLAKVLEKETLFVGHIKAKSNETDVKKLLDRYAPSESEAKNSEILGCSSEIKKAHLESTIQVLLTLTDEFPALVTKLAAAKASTKPLLAKEIVSFIRAARQNYCRKCTSDYAPYHVDNTESKLACFVCASPCHKGCYDDSNTDEETGLVFLCHSCVVCLGGNPSGISQISKAVKEPPNQASGSELDAVKDKEKPQEEKPPVDDSSKKFLRYDRTRSVCPLLLSGSCSHGISGKDCPHYHPPWCFRYQRNGPKGRNGCRSSADACRFYHPKLCENALNAGTCLSSTCKEVHITGTITRKENLGKKQRRNAGSSQPESSKRKATEVLQSDRKPRKRSASESSENAPAKSVHFSKPYGQTKEEDFQQHLLQMKADITKDITAAMSSWFQTQLSPLQTLLAQPQHYTSSQQPTQPAPSLNLSHLLAPHNPSPLFSQLVSHGQRA